MLCPKDFIERLEYNRKPQKGDNSYLPYGNINMCGILVKAEEDDNVITTIAIDEKGNVNVKTDGNVVAMCPSFVIKKDENSSPVFEVTP